MLVKLHSREYEEDYGMLVDCERPYIQMFEHGAVRLSRRMRPVQVVRVIAMWMDEDIVVKCDVADTEELKRIGLQKYSSLEEYQGLYFPYPSPADVTFHQGTVSFPLDLLFLRDSEVVQIEQNTEVGGTEHWGCESVDGVIEVNGGFCDKHRINVGSRLALFASSAEDEQEWKDEHRAVSMVGEIARQL
jgi:uncharacterized membrane protein (UPF0127 family)